MRKEMTREYLKSGGADWKDKAMTIAVGTYTSDAIRTHFSEGKADLVIKTSAGTLAVTYQVSDLGTDWYTAYDNTGAPITTLTTGIGADRWISFTLIPCNYVRFVFELTVANSTVSAIYHQQEEA